MNARPSFRLFASVAAAGALLVVSGCAGSSGLWSTSGSVSYTVYGGHGYFYDPWDGHRPPYHHDPDHPRPIPPGVPDESDRVPARPPGQGPGTPIQPSKPGVPGTPVKPGIPSGPTTPVQRPSIRPPSNIGRPSPRPARPRPVPRAPRVPRGRR